MPLSPPTEHIIVLLGLTATRSIRFTKVGAVSQVGLTALSDVEGVIKIKASTLGVAYWMFSSMYNSYSKIDGNSANVGTFRAYG